MKTRNIWFLLGVAIGLFLVLIATVRDFPDKPSGTFVCIAQYVSHPALDAVRTSFESVLHKSLPNVAIHFQNAEGDPTTARTLADQFCSTDCSLVFALATPMAQAVHARCQRPWIFGAITDPVSAGLVKTMSAPGGFATGTSDQWPYRLQMEAIKVVFGEGARVGVPHNPGEANSEFAMQQTRAAAVEMGLKVEEVPVHSVSEVSRAVESLRGRVDVVYVPADNTSMAGAPAIVATAGRIGIPVVAGDPGTFKAGAAFGLGVSYSNLGVLNAGQTARILSGQDPAGMPVAVSDKPELYVSEERMGEAGLDPNKLRSWAQQKGFN